ncbi:hypothetical protein [Halomonas halophila]|uniref:hypothetical protein n=1 Tax=Halomonas halophila TaxID=29573 RepID=UPI000A82ADF0
MRLGRDLLGLAMPPGHTPHARPRTGPHDAVPGLEMHTPSRPAVTSGVMSPDLLTGRAMRWSRHRGRSRSDA